MPDSLPDVASISIAPMEPADALAVGKLHRSAMPWSILSKMGARFAGRFIFWIHQQEHSRVWVAKAASGNVVGIMAGTLDRPKIYRNIVRQHFLRLSIAAALNVWRPGVLAWLFRAACERIRPPRPVSRSAPRPAAEGLFLAVTEEAKGTGLAQKLRVRREADFRSWGFNGTYVLLTLSSNARSNALQRKLGGRLVAEIPTRGHLIYEWHKDVSPDGD